MIAYNMVINAVFENFERRTMAIENGDKKTLSNELGR